MIEEKRGPGRPPKVRPEAAPALTEQDVRANTALGLAFERPPVVETPAPAADRLSEVLLMRKYAPGNQDQEIMRYVPAGTVIKLPVAEALRALKLGIARATDNTFG